MQPSDAIAIPGPAASAGDASLRARLLPWGLLVLRIFIGMVFLSNGLAKLFGFNHFKPLPGFLIDYNGARSIIKDHAMHHPIEPYKRLVLDLFVPHWGFFGHVVGLGETAVGLALVLGLLTPLMAFAVFGMAFHLWFSNWGADSDFVWDYWTEFIPALTLAFASAGRFYGLDRLLAERFPALRRWPLT